MVPRQRDDPVEVRARDVVFARLRRHFLEPVELALRLLVRLLGQVEFLDALAEILPFRRAFVRLAELLLDRFELPAQDELALVLVELGLDLRGDLGGEFGGLEFAAEVDVDFAEPFRDVDRLQALLALRDGQVQRGGDDVGQAAHVVNVQDRQLELVGQVRREVHELLELLDHAARHGARFDVVVQDALHPRDVGLQIRAGGGDLVEAHAREPLHENARGLVGELHHLQDGYGATDLVEVVRAGVLGLLIRGRLRSVLLDRHDHHEAVADDHVVDEAQVPLLVDGDGQYHLGKEDEPAHGQHRHFRRQRHALDLGLAERKAVHLGRLSLRPVRFVFRTAAFQRLVVFFLRIAHQAIAPSGDGPIRTMNHG